MIIFLYIGSISAYKNFDEYFKEIEQTEEMLRMRIEKLTEQYENKLNNKSSKIKYAYGSIFVLLIIICIFGFVTLCVAGTMFSWFGRLILGPFLR